RKVAATSKKKAIHIADQVTLDVIDLAANLTASKGACLLLEGAPAGLIDGLKTSGGGMGLRAGGKVDVQVKNVHIAKAREAGILLFETADLTIIGGVVEACRTGVEIREQARPRINSVTISACETGVRCLDDSLPRINNCKIADCKEGARVQDKSAPIIHRLEVSGGKPKGFGVGWF
ncbi:MAG: hypothetical protein GY859_24335, partial [Desulfobacterales bacterium]|nr:hypothetical protein [Desulfobacterales bacterium]